jgi:hypothetical protein
MQITGERVVLRDQLRQGDKEIWFRWLNLEEWQYCDEPDTPFRSVNRETVEAMWNYWGSSSPSLHRYYIDMREGRFIGWVNRGVVINDQAVRRRALTPRPSCLPG